MDLNRSGIRRRAFDMRDASTPSPDYSSGFPHTKACNAGSTRVLGETYRSPDR